MPIATRTFRVFVSSTFEDLKAERDALQRDVFPRRRKLCEENNARFTARTSQRNPGGDANLKWVRVLPFRPFETFRRMAATTSLRTVVSQQERQSRLQSEGRDGGRFGVRD